MRDIVTTPYFERKLKKVLTRDATLERRFLKTLGQLRQDPFAHMLKTHKLSGRLRGAYACSVTRDIRIVFTLDNTSVFLLNIGAHDDVY